MQHSSSKYYLNLKVKIIAGSDVKSTWEISSTTNPFYESNERPGMENSQGITSRAPSYPMFESLSARLRSFSNWPNHMTQTPHQMASAGFFYKGYGDSTLCFFCGGGLKEWKAGDDPLVSSVTMMMELKQKPYMSRVFRMTILQGLSC